MKLCNIPFTIRLGTTDDINFVFDSWYKSVKHIYPNQYDKDFGMKHQISMKKIIDASVITVANLDSDLNEILSYIVYGSFNRRIVIHYAYTKADARNQGLCSSLVSYANPEKLPIIFTNAPKNENIMSKLINFAIFDPNIIHYMNIS